MTRSNTLSKPGERAPASGTYYCYICALRDEASTCDVQVGAMFVACSRCLEAGVAEWDMTWKAAEDKPGSRGKRTASPWPGSLGKPS